MENVSPEIIQRITLAELQSKRAKAVLDSLADFCHALGQPATVLLSSMELLRIEGVDEETKKQVTDLCYDAVIEIRTLLAEMKAKRVYAAEAYAAGEDFMSALLANSEVCEKAPPKASWEK